MKKQIEKVDDRRKRKEERIQIEKLNMIVPGTDKKVEKRRPTMEEAFELVHDSFVAAAERQIHVADSINIKIITKNGIEEREVPLSI